MDQSLPIRFQQLLELPALGINPASITFTNLTLESSKYICVREPATQPNQQGQVVIVDMEKPHSPVRRPITGDSAIMNPRDNILALRAGNVLQVFNIQEKTKLKGYQMPDAVVFWTWINPTEIAIVTNKSVFHWSTADATSDPVKIFDRLPSLNEHQIINYHADSTGKWLVLIGIAPVQGRVVGNMQLYSVERRVSQPIEGHAAAFLEYTLPGTNKPTTLFSFATRTPAQSKLYVIEVGKNETDSGPKFQRRATDIYFPPEAQADFPVSMEVGKKYQVAYLITKLGYLHIFDLISGAMIFMNKISQDKDTIFTTCPQPETGGLVGVNRSGKVLAIGINDSTIIPYITAKGDLELAIKMAARANLPGADDLFSKQFNTLFAQQRYQDAARVAAESPNQFLRTQQTIRLFQSQPGVAGQPPPVLQYFGVLLEKGKLTRVETIELSRPVLQQGRKDLLEKWISEDKLDYSEELGDLVRQLDLKLALSVYLKAGAKDKIVLLLAETGQFPQLVQWCAQEKYTPDWMRLITVLLASNPQGAVNLSKLLLSAESGPLVDRNAVVDAFISRNMLQETTALLLDVLSGNKPEDAALQSKLLELNLMQAPQVADAILANEMFSHYNRRRVAELAEKAGLFNRALEHYTDMADWKRCIRNAHTMNPDFVVAWFGKIQPADRMACLNEMLTSNLRANITVAVKVAVRYAEELGASALIKMFENYKSTEGVFFFLQQVVDASTEAEVHFKYIEAAAKLGQVKEVERIVRQSNHYEPERVRDFLKEAKLPDQLPLVIVCDKYNFVDDLTNYLFKNQMLQSIEAYVTTINPMNTPIVVGALLDSGCPEDFILQLVNTVGNLCSADQLIEEIEKRNRLKILQSWLETRFREGNQEPALHNAIAKIYVDDRKDAEKFLTSNQFYDSRVVGRYCENRDPFLAFVAYKRGMCDKELIEVTNKHSLFKHQARYLVERQDLALWATVLSNEDSSVRRQLIDQVVQTALPESKKPEEVSCAVKAFMVANLPNELIELLEKIVLDNPNSDFGRNKSLQNLLIVTAIRSHSAENPDRAMSFIKRLDNFETGEVAEIAKEHKLYEEAFAIYSKVGDHVNAVMVLIENVGDLERAYDYADRLNRPDVWTKLGRAQLRQGKVKEAIASFIKGNDPEDYVEVIDAANRADLAEDLIKFLVMARTRVREQRVDSELAYAYAKADRLAELDAFVAGPNVANVQDVADRCFNEGVYEAARLLYSSINNFAKLAVTLLRLQQFGPAVDAARKANSTATWKEVSRACVEAKQFRLAQVAGLAIIVHGDELEEVIRFYENHGHFDELMALIEAGLGLERAHVGMFTELAILYSKYKPAKLMEHLKLWNSRLNIPKVAQACEKNQQWKELSFLYITYDEFDKAVVCMISHSEDAWDHVLLKEIIAKVSNVEHYYKVVRFYFDEHPTMANDLLTSLAAKIDHTRVVLLAREVGQLALIKNYLVNVQDANIPAVNEALAELYIEEEDFAALRASIDSHNNFDAIGLAKKLEKHELLEFRRIAAYLYKKNGRYQQSMDLSKKDKLYQDAMRAAADSDDHEVAENLLAYFVENGDKEAFSACLYICYNLIRPDVALELAWKNKMLDNAFPFIIQVLREYTSKVDKLQAAEDARKAQQEAMQQSQQPPPHVLATMGGPLPPGVIDPTGIPQLFATQVAPPGVMMTGPVGMHPGMMQPPMGHHPHMSFPH